MNRNNSYKNPDTESALEEATVQLFQSLGWETIHAIDEVDEDTTLLGRKHQGEEG